MNEQQILKQMKKINKVMLFKLKKRSIKHPKDDILNKNITYNMLNLKDLIHHLDLEYKEFRFEWNYRKYTKMRKELIDIMNICFLIYSYIEMENLQD